MSAELKLYGPYRAALQDIAETKNLTATPEQFIRHLQGVARNALASEARTDCMSSYGPIGCNRVRCQLAKKCAAEIVSPAAANAGDLDVGPMVNRFLGWKLPQDFYPDAGISFKAPQPPFGWPTGTNLLHAGQAKAMFEHCLKDAARPTDEHLWDQTIHDRDAFHEMADKLAQGVAEHFGQDIGEHSSANSPWLNALDILNTKPEFASCAGTAQAPTVQRKSLTDADILVMVEIARERGSFHSLADPTDAAAIAFARTLIATVEGK